MAQIFIEIHVVDRQVSHKANDESIIHRQIESPLIIIFCVVFWKRTSVEDFIIGAWPRHASWTSWIIKMRMRIKILFAICVILLGCQSSDKTTPHKEELKREAFKLQLGMTLTPENVAGHLQLGEIYHKLGEPEKAINEFQSVLQLDERNAQAYNGLGLVYTDLRLIDPAIEAFQKAIELEPNNPTFYNNLGYAYDTDDQFEKAVDAYREAIELDPKFQDAYYNLAAAYHARDLFEDAIKYYQHAIDLDSSDADAHYNLGEVYRETKQLDLAIQEYKKALSIDATDPQVYYQLAQAYQQKGDSSTMQRYLNLFLEHAGNLPQFQDEVENAKQMKRESEK